MLPRTIIKSVKNYRPVIRSRILIYKEVGLAAEFDEKYGVQLRQE